MFCESCLTALAEWGEAPVTQNHDAIKLGIESDERRWKGREMYPRPSLFLGATAG